MFDDCFNGKRVFLIASKSDTSFNVGENPSRTTRTSRNTVRVQRAKRVRSQAVISARRPGRRFLRFLCTLTFHRSGSAGTYGSARFRP